MAGRSISTICGCSRSFADPLKLRKPVWPNATRKQTIVFSNPYDYVVGAFGNDLHP